MSEYPKRLYSVVMQKNFWVSATSSSPVNDEPCYSFSEIQLIKKCNPKLSRETLLAIYNIKKTLGAELTDMSPYEVPIKDQRALEMTNETIEIIKRAKIRNNRDIT